MTKTDSSRITLLRVPAVCGRTGLTRSGLYREIAAGNLTPIKLGARAVAFSSLEVDSWIADRIDAAQGSAA